MTPLQADNRTVALTVPARPDYLVLARLALSAVCRLTPLKADDVADLKLAVTEAASGFVGGLPGGAPAAAEGEAPPLSFFFRLGDHRLEVELVGTQREDVSDEERDLGRAIIEATVDECSYENGTVRLAKNLAADED
jgi:serine/threonine-protein kinase RsbW